jgi:hypothetical protein
MFGHIARREYTIWVLVAAERQRGCSTRAANFIRIVNASAIRLPFSEPWSSYSDQVSSEEGADNVI